MMGADCDDDGDGRSLFQMTNSNRGSVSLIGYYILVMLI